MTIPRRKATIAAVISLAIVATLAFAALVAIAAAPADAAAPTITDAKRAKNASTKVHIGVTFKQRPGPKDRIIRVEHCAKKRQAYAERRVTAVLDPTKIGGVNPDPSPRLTLKTSWTCWVYKKDGWRMPGRSTTGVARIEVDAVKSKARLAPTVTARR